MKQHEVEALRGLVASWGKRNNPNFDICAKELEALLISFPAPDDGLREGLEGKIKELRGDASKRLESGHSFIAEGILKACDDIDFVLAKTPDPWKPIADAPRDGSWFLASTIHTKSMDILHWDGKELRDKERNIRDPRFWRKFRPLPAPPREGKG